MLLLGFAGNVRAEAVARVNGCLPTGGPCQVRVGLKPAVEHMQATSAVFITLMAVDAAGNPNPQLGGFYSPKGGWQTGTPKPAWTGRLSRKAATVPFPEGGVCALVQSAQGPAGKYSMYVGWGEFPESSLQNDDETMQLVREAMTTTDPDMRSKLSELNEQYQQAKQNTAGHANVYALSSMMKNESYWKVATFDCSNMMTATFKQDGAK
jgi:hypothetical protein